MPEPSDPDFPAYTLIEAAAYWRVSLSAARRTRTRFKLGKRRYELNQYHAGPVWKLSLNEIKSIPQAVPSPLRSGYLLAEDRAYAAYANEIDGLYPELV